MSIQSCTIIMDLIPLMKTEGRFYYFYQIGW